MEKQNNKVNKITTTHSIYLEFILHYKMKGTKVIYKSYASLGPAYDVVIVRKFINIPEGVVIKW